MSQVQSVGIFHIHMNKISFFCHPSYLDFDNDCIDIGKHSI